MQIHPLPPNVSILECLRILRDKANAWNAFKLNVTKSLRVTLSFNPSTTSVTHQQLFFSSLGRLSSRIINLRGCESATTVDQSSDHDIHASFDPTGSAIFMDEMQDLMIIVNLPRGSPTYQLNFLTISTNKEHPLAYKSRVELTYRVPCDEIPKSFRVAILGDRIAIYSDVKLDNYPYWSLYVWNWCEGDQHDVGCLVQPTAQRFDWSVSKDVYVLDDDYTLFDIRFLTKEKLLAVTSRSHIELYNVDNLSTAPQLQARFILPVTPQSLFLAFPSVYHSTWSCAHFAAQDERWIWTTISADRVICCMSYSPMSIFVISARLFCMDIPPTWFDRNSYDGLAVPWSSWGPQNSRCFLQHSNLPFGVGGSRIIRTVVDDGPWVRMHMTDFNPSAVARGIGKVVREPTTFPVSMSSFTEDVTTYLPYVEVVNDRRFPRLIDRVILDEERVLMFTSTRVGTTVGALSAVDIMKLTISLSRRWWISR